MNSLSDAIIFKEFITSKLGTGVLKNLQPNIAALYKVNRVWYEHYFKIFKGYKYPLAKAVCEYGEKENVCLVNYGDPEDPDKVPIFNLPPYIISFANKTSDGSLVSYSNIAPRAKYIRNKISNEIESLKITERELYAFLQIATTNYILITKREELRNNVKFAKLNAELYANALSRCINKTYPLSAEREDIIVLNFFCAIFCLQTMFGYDVDKSISYAYSLRNVEKSVIETNCKMLDDSLTMKTIEDLIKIIENEFTHIRKGSITYRNLMLMFTRMYGQNATFAMEHYFSFLTLVQMSSMRIGMFNDAAIDQISKPYLKDIETLIFSVTGL